MKTNGILVFPPKFFVLCVTAPLLPQMMLLMSPTRTLPTHGEPCPKSELLPWTVVYPGTWLARPRPHACSRTGCGLMRAHVAWLWSRVACSVERAHTARLAVARLLPPELCRLCTRRA